MVTLSSSDGGGEIVELAVDTRWPRGSSTDDGNATFDSPGRAIECALAIRETLKAFDIGVRAGIHTGEIEVRGDDVAGMAAHIGARVSALAGPGEVLVSSTVKDSVVGSSVEFEERGEHEPKGRAGLVASVLGRWLTPHAT